MLHKLFQKTEGIPPNSLYKVSIAVLLKPDKDIKRKLQTNIPYEYRHKNSQQNVSTLNLSTQNTMTKCDLSQKCKVNLPSENQLMQYTTSTE